MTDIHTLYAITHSLYSGRARSYLIKNNIPFRELSTGHESFKAEVLPKGKLPTIPTLVTPQGEVIRDGAAIIEHFEGASGRPCRPPGPRQQIVSALFDVLGTDGLLRPAMHYRWNFPAENLDFLRYHFLYSQRDTDSKEAKTDHMMDRMRHAGVAFGVSDENKELVEELYMELLFALDKHFTALPYLLGWKPCIGDFGLLAPMYAHLGRDPKPLRIMQQQAIRTYRWVERMNQPGQDAPEFFTAGTDYLANDEIPETLLSVLRVLAEDFVPETIAAAARINDWLTDNHPDPGASASRALGLGEMAEFTLRGHTVKAIAQPYRFYLLQRVQGIYASLEESDKAGVDVMLASCGMSGILSTKLDRQLGRSDNLEVWL